VVTNVGAGRSIDWEETHTHKTHERVNDLACLTRIPVNRYHPSLLPRIGGAARLNSSNQWERGLLLQLVCLLANQRADKPLTKRVACKMPSATVTLDRTSSYPSFCLACLFSEYRQLPPCTRDPVDFSGPPSTSKLMCLQQ
jgi:hypothetical protein